MSLRYKINVVEELKKNGISSYTLLKTKDPKYTLGQSAFSKLKRGETDISCKSLEVICRLLCLQPGDILEFIDD